MSSSELSELTSNVSTDDGEEGKPPVKKGTLDHFFKDAANTTELPKVKKKRPPSPPHEYVLADREEIAFLVMFRSRFSDLLPKSLPHLGPQDIENGIVGAVPSDQVEGLLCAILGLVLNRKKEVEKGHYNRALEDAISQHTAQWPLAWQGRNRLRDDGSFNNMSPEEKLVLLKALVLWSFESSDAVKIMIKDCYKHPRHEDDLNQPLSVQPWGRDGDKRRFWLIEGQDDTQFRLYRESNPTLKYVTWRSIAGSIEELREVADRLGEENTIASRRLRDRILAAIPRFEAGEEKRRRRDYRLQRKAQFIRPEPGFSLYEGRTRGKRIKYTYSDDEGAASDGISTRRSHRQSGFSTPAEPAAPRFSASGRQIRSRHGGEYGESLLTGRDDVEDQGQITLMDHDAEDEEPVITGRPRQPAYANGVRPGRPRKKIDKSGSWEEASDDGGDETTSSNEWNGAEDDDDADQEDDEDELDMSEDEMEGEEQDEPNPSLVVRLKYIKGQSKSPQPNGQRSSGHISIGTSSKQTWETSLPHKGRDEEVTDAPPIPPACEPRGAVLHTRNGIAQDHQRPGPSPTCPPTQQPTPILQLE